MIFPILTLYVITKVIISRGITTFNNVPFFISSLYLSLLDVFFSSLSAAVITTIPKYKCAKSVNTHYIPSPLLKPLTHTIQNFFTSFPPQQTNGEYILVLVFYRSNGTSTVHPVQFSLPFQSFIAGRLVFFHNGLYHRLIDHILWVNKYSLILCLFHLPSHRDNKQQSDTQGNPQTTLYTSPKEQSLSIHPSPDKDCNSGSGVAIYFCNTSLRESFFHFTPMKVKLHETID